MTIRDNVQYSITFLVDQEGSQAGFARKIGTTKQAVANWVKAKNAPDIETIARIAEVYKVPLESILNGNLEIVPEKPMRQNDDHDFIVTPIVASIAAGEPMDIMEIENSFPCPTAVKSNHQNSAWFRVDGNSYTEGGLHDGMYVLVDFDLTQIIPNTPYAIQVNNRVTIKAVEELENGIKLVPKSYDPTYRPIIFDYSKNDGDEVKVLGQAVYASFPYDWEF